MHTFYQRITAYMLLFSQMLIGCLNPIVLPDKNNLEPIEKSNINLNGTNLVKTGNEKAKMVLCRKETMVADYRVDQAMTNWADLELEKTSSALDPLPIQSYNAILSEQKEIMLNKQNNIDRAHFLYQQSALNKPINLAKPPNSASKLIETSRPLHTTQHINQAKRKAATNLLSANKNLEPSMSKLFH